MKKKSPSVVQVSGSRKKAIARATVKPGNGLVRINSLELNGYGNLLSRMKIKEPLMVAGKSAKEYDFNIKVAGGGWMSQAEAVRLTIAKGLVAITKSDDLRKRFIAYDRNLLVADSRQTEPHKPCRSSARAAKQTSKR
ncbi:MAG: 30S ribosomal protein S9 [Candidatus Nanoarchaeia archaeon]|jgi:small subunit ribosomal protein S9